MNEVACRVLGVFFHELKRKKLPPDVLIQGTGYPLERLLDKHEYIDWSAFCQLMRNAEQVWTEDELIAMGSAYLRSPWIRPVTAAAWLLYTVKDFYRWTFDQQHGPGRQLFSCIEATFQEVEKDHYLVEHMISEGYEPIGRGYLLVALGTFAAMPMMVGAQPARIEMELTARGAMYDIRVTEAGGSLRWLRRFVMFPFTARAAAHELSEAHELLVARYKELSSARDAIARQAIQLGTAHRINNAVRTSMDLDHRVEAIVETLVNVGNFKAVELKVSSELDSAIVHLEARRGNGEAAEEMIYALESQGKPLGSLKLWRENDSDPAERKELLEFVIPIVALALEEAISYSALLDYRENLQRKVDHRTAELLEAQRVRDRIFANINHEIRTPLSLIMLTTAELQRQRLGSDATASLLSIERSARQLLRLVEGFLLLASGQENKLTMKRQVFDVGDLLRNIVETWMPVAACQDIELRYRGPGSYIAAFDTMAVERIVANLLSNALKFTSAGGSITLTMLGTPDVLELSVEDTGVGIADDMRNRLFGRFEQGEAASKPGVRGSGLGLSLVKELAEAHGGTVDVTSETGKGSRFRVRLPCISLTGDAIPHEERAPTLHPADFGHRTQVPLYAGEYVGPEAATETILVAEDDAELCAVIARLLSSHYRVLTAPNGKAAMELAASAHVDLLVSDIEMPLLDGLELTRQWRDLPGNQLAPVVLLTAHGRLEDRLAGFDAGAIDFVLKPFEPLELLARVRSQLRIRAMAIQLLETEKLRAEVAEFQARAAEAQSVSIALNSEREQKEMLQRFSQKLLDSQEQERKRIAGDLHDTLGQELLAIKNQLTLVLQNGPLQEKSIERLEQAAEMASSALTDVRRISRNLRPLQLERSGLSDTLRDMLSQVAESTSLQVTGEIAEIDGLFTREAEINVYRIVQEALNNVVKHADAEAVTVVVARNNGEVLLSVSDDGRGFDAIRSHETAEPVGLGLQGMMERAQMLGGEIRMESAPGAGTTVRVRLPVRTEG